MKMKSYQIILTFTLLSFYGSGVANESQRLNITGRIIDSEARPVERAEVAVYEQFDDYLTGQDYAKLLDKIKKTDSKGNFVLNADINLWYRVFIVARKEGFALGWDVMASSVGERSENKYIILEKPCSLAGIVVDEKGKPAAGAKIRALPKTDYSERLEQRPILAPEQWLTTLTDDKGYFQFDNFSADVSSDFLVEAPGWSSVYQYTTHWLSAYGFKTGRTDIRLVLPKEIPVQGRIIDAETGEPVTGAHVVIKPDNIREHKNPYCPHRTVSESDGKFYFKGIPPGRNSIKVSVTDETTGLVDKRIKVDIQADKDSKDIIVELDKGGLIEITAREEGTNKPASDIPIYFWQAEQDEKSNFYKDAITDKDGKLRIWAPPGECAFNARYDRNFFQTYQDQILVIKGQTAKSEIVFDGIPSVSGLVLDQTNQPVSGVLVMANPVGEQGITDKAGRFEVRYSPSEPLERLIARDLTRNLAAIVEVKNDAKPIQITLKPALSIVGRIADPDSVGIPAARLALTLNVPGWLTYFGPEILTNFMGQYEIKALPLLQEGFGYRISVNSSGYGNKNYERISITGKPGTTTEIKPLVLQPADQSISGSVIDAEDKPATGAVIFMRGKNQPIRRTVTDSNGGFIIKRVCKGPLRIQANSDNRPEGDGFIKAEGGDQNVKIILGQDRIHTKHISLTGKQLPDFQDFNIDLSPPDANGKMIMVCFWDMQQRPSRNCMQELAERAEKLEQKGVTVIAIQAPKVDEKALSKWVQENKIPFPVGIVQSDEQQIRFAWGVQSLPWLILTDRKHIVVAEGFSIAELADKLKGCESPKAVERSEIEVSRPQAQESSGWKNNFERVYRLSQGEVLKRIAPPFIAERREYLTEEMPRYYTPGRVAPLNAIIFQWDGHLTRSGWSCSAGYSLAAVLQAVIGLEYYEFELAGKLQYLLLKGDWIVRKDSTVEDRLKAFELILKNQIGKEIRFTKRRASRPLIVATGSFRFHPLSGTYDDSRLHFFADALDPARPDYQREHHTLMSANAVPWEVGRLAGLQVINQTEPSDETMVRCSFHRSAYLAGVKDEGQMNRKLDLLLANITSQTGLKFAIKRQTAELWCVAELKRSEDSAVN